MLISDLEYGDAKAHVVGAYSSRNPITGGLRIDISYDISSPKIRKALYFNEREATLIKEAFLASMHLPIDELNSLINFVSEQESLVDTKTYPGVNRWFRDLMLLFKFRARNFTTKEVTS
jgi:hypothetical protein